MDQLVELQELLDSYGIKTSESQVQTLLRHLELLVEKNKLINLTRVTSESEALVIHILDSLLPLPYLQNHFDSQKVSFVDIGTGGGYPGIPLAVMTGWNGTLIDSVGKKAFAVQEFITDLEIDSHTYGLQVRAEELAQKRPESFDLVVTRAVAQANSLVEYASPLLSKNGLLALYKARPSEEEILAADKAAKLCGMSFVSRETFELPGDAGHREILYYQKTGKAKIKLPRRVGLATKEPLGL